MGERGEVSTVVLATEDNDYTQAWWPHRYGLKLRVAVGAELALALETSNQGEEPFEFSAALHTYFQISEVADARIHGLEGTRYLDKVQDFAAFTQPGVLAIDRRVDRVFVDTETACAIEDPGFKRRIVVEKSGSRTTVVWNPWEQVSAEVADLGPGAYRRFVCVETVLGPQEHKLLAPGERHALEARMRVEGG